VDDIIEDTFDMKVEVDFSATRKTTGKEYGMRFLFGA